MNRYMYIALVEALKAFYHDDVPVGCVIVKNNKIISKSHNKNKKDCNCLYHAEIIAINNACKKLNCSRLDGCVMYVTLKPCMMCMGAIISARIKYVYYGAENKSKQMYDNNQILRNINLNRTDNILCSKILSVFFQNKRK